MKHSLSSIKTLAAAQNRLNRKSNQTAPVAEVLGLIGQALDVERVGLFKLSTDGAQFELVAQWANEGITKQDNKPLVIDTLEALDTVYGQVHAEPVFNGPNFTGMLMLETGGIHKQFEPEAKELVRNSAIMLAPYLNVKVSTPSPPKLNRPNDGIQSDASDDLNILIVEDNETNLFVLEKYIQKFGAISHVARNGQEAVQSCKEMKFDLILMDLSMPKLDGFDATREIVTGENLNRKTPIVAVTADVTDGIERRCRKLGIQQYISKPILQNTLIKVISELTNKKPKNN